MLKLSTLHHLRWDFYTTCDRQNAIEESINNGVCPALCFSVGLAFFLAALSSVMTGHGLWLQRKQYSRISNDKKGDDKLMAVKSQLVF